MIYVMLMIVSSQAALAASSLVDQYGITERPDMSIDTAKNGIVRVIGAVESEDGKVTDKTKTSGFIISKDGSNVYIITTLHAVDFGEKGRIKIAVKNDSTVPAEMVQENREHDFCILAAENSFNDKSEVAIRADAYDDANDKISAGDEATALGFSFEIGDASDFNAEDVTSLSGTVAKTAAENGGAFVFDAMLPNGMDGGILVDKDGYAIGLINQTIKTGKGQTAATNITEIDEMLVSKAISYRSKDKDIMYNELYELCVNAEDLYKRADKDTKTEVSTTANEAMQVLQERPNDREALTASLGDFNTVIENANLKTPKSHILAYVLGAINVILLVKLITLMVWNHKHSPNNSINGAVQAGEVPRMFGNPSYNDNSQSFDYHNSAPPQPSRQHDLKLRWIRTGQVFMLDKTVVEIGKSLDNDIVISGNNKVSRKHAAVENRGGIYYLRDLGSTNGTYLNNRRIDGAEIPLNQGDVIRLAGEEIVLM